MWWITALSLLELLTLLALLMLLTPLPFRHGIFRNSYKIGQKRTARVALSPGTGRCRTGLKFEMKKINNYIVIKRDLIQVADHPGTRDRTRQAFKHNHTRFVYNALWVWKPMHIHQGRFNVIKSFHAIYETSNRIPHRLLGQETKANVRVCENIITVIQPTMKQCMHQETFWFDRQGFQWISRSWK